VDLLASYTDRYEVWLEIGLPSVHDATLKLINRHHTIADFLQNFYLARKRPLKIAVHVILGLPGEGEKEIMETAKVCGELRLDGIKIHPLYLIRGTPLEKSAKDFNLHLLDRQEYARLAGQFLEYLWPQTVILRLTGECRPDLLVAPNWVNQKHLVVREIENWLAAHQTYQGARYS
ncbi:MAG: TIGR01212 family radical SAM protein, partial [Candidatus Omnitrophica bacterium]|nr:TIGR01212 family radical SAM protein [Candidatus Omnitrophota bacterium]